MAVTSYRASTPSAAQTFASRRVGLINKRKKKLFYVFVFHFFSIAFFLDTQANLGPIDKKLSGCHFLVFYCQKDWAFSKKVSNKHKLSLEKFINNPVSNIQNERLESLKLRKVNSASNIKSETYNHCCMPILIISKIWKLYDRSPAHQMQLSIAWKEKAF